jgi:hypothetical protein
MRMARELPEDLVNRLMALRPPPSTKQLAQIFVAFRDGDINFGEVERCPHCGGELRRRRWVSAAVLKILKEWKLEHERNGTRGEANDADRAGEA